MKRGALLVDAAVAVTVAAASLVAPSLLEPSAASRRPAPVWRELRTFELQTLGGQVNVQAAVPNGIVVLDDALDVVAIPGDPVTLDVPGFTADDFEATLVGRFLSGAGSLQFHFHATERSGDAVVVSSDGRVGALGQGKAPPLYGPQKRDVADGVTRVRVPSDDLADGFTLRLRSVRALYSGLISQRSFFAVTEPRSGALGVKIVSDPATSAPLRIRVQYLKITAPGAVTVAPT